jgi:hypothetical protein
VGTTNRRRAFALAIFASLTGWVGTVSAAPTQVEIAEAIRDLDADHDSAIRAAQVLQGGGAAAATAIRDAWPSLSSLGQQRAIGPLSQLAITHDAAVEALVEAARSENEQVQKLGLAALRRSGVGRREGLVVLVADPSVGDRAASLLAHTDPDFAIEPLLHALAPEGGADRRGLRLALTVAVQRAEHPQRELAAWLQTKPSGGAVASAVLGFSALEAHRDMASAFIEYALSDANDFPTKWRLLQSSETAGRSDVVDQWVRQQLYEPEEWMLRQAAVDAITARGHREAARVSLSDAYPRVRSRAATVLSGDSDTLVERATLARRDTWPLVRAEAVSSLRGEADAIPVIVAAVDDSMSVVRAAAIDALAASSHDEGWERVHARLRARNEWPPVTEAAIGYVVAHCRKDAVDALLRLVMRAAPSNALTDDLNNAARAIEALRALGTPEANAAVEQLRETDGVPPTLKMALEQPPPKDGGCASSGR